VADIKVAKSTQTLPVFKAGGCIKLLGGLL
jgi:hypothetical protein